MAAVDSLRDKWESISPRERSLVALLGIAAIVVAVLYVALAISDRLDALEAKNASARSALHKLTAYRAAPRSATSLGDPRSLITADPIKLDSYIYKAGTAANVTVPEVNPRTPVTRGKYQVHASQISVRDLTLAQVKDLLQAIESDSRIVVVTSLQIRRNFRDAEKMDLTAEIATYSKLAETDGAGAGSGSSKGSGGS